MSGAEPLRVEERETISRELSRGSSARDIGKLLGREHGTISREIKRNGGATEYRACAAQERYESLKARPKERKLVASARLHDAVNAGLELKWSPEQISARLDEDYPDDPEMRVSHETIYQTLGLAVEMGSDRSVREECRRVLRAGQILRSWRAGSIAC